MNGRWINTALACSTALWALLAGAAAQDAPAQPVVMLDRIVAVVNNEVITNQDLQERQRAATLRLQQQGTPLPPAEVLAKQVLENMIYNRVQLQYARDTG